MDGAAQPAAPPRPTDAEFFHSHVFPDGEVVSGIKPLNVLQAEADVVHRFSMAGKSVLDVGAWDGFQSFEAERRGAARVLATDHFCWNGPGWADKRGFDYAKFKFGSRVEELEIDVPDITPEALGGTFDVVLFLGVLYHVKDPLVCLERMAAVTAECLIVETETAFDLIPWPVMRYYKRYELNDDPTNYWAPNKLCLTTMLQELGFTRFEIAPTPFHKQSWKRGRIIMHAFR